jgi:hypothetical protein
MMHQKPEKWKFYAAILRPKGLEFVRSIARHPYISSGNKRNSREHDLDLFSITDIFTSMKSTLFL